MDDRELSRLEGEVQLALRRGEPSGLAVLGYGEISLVLGWPSGAPRWACKRLPPMRPAAAAAYGEQVRRYLDALASRGVDPVETDVRPIETATGDVVVYCVQPALPPASLARAVVAGDPDRAPGVLEGIVDAVLATTGPRVGFDAQLANWAVEGGRLRYFDVTTPLLRRDDGTEELDTELFLASLPWLLRSPVRRVVVPSILDRYHDPRTVVLDLAANLFKERLAQWAPTVVEAAGDRIDPPLTVEEARRDYRKDARTWAALQALRRADRWWQQRVRRRTYPVLLPARISR